MFDVHVYINEDEVIKTHIPDKNDNGLLRYIAANPTEHRYSYSGSALPYANYAQAFDNTPNKGEHLIMDGFFTVHIKMPNSFYCSLGKVRVPPTLYIDFLSHGKRKEYAIALGHGIRNRLLSHPMERKSPVFYGSLQSLPVRSQNEIIRDSSAQEFSKHNERRAFFWGMKPPV
jgi:hypothetical protein